MKIQLIFSLLFTLFISNQIFCQNPLTKWRGPEGNGIYPETGLLKEWPSSGPEILWTFDELGVGYSSPVIAHGKVYVSGMIDQTGFVFAFDKAGKLLWKVSYGEEFHESYPGSRSSVTIAGNLIYVMSGKGILSCLHSKNGQLEWKKKLFDDFDGENIRWGATESLVVDGEKLFCTPGGKTNNIIALNRYTGKLIWSSPGKGDNSAYCSPLLVDLDSRKLLVTHTANDILGLDADSGKLLWSYPHTNKYSIHPNTPIYHDGKLFCFSGYGKGNVMLGLNKDGSKATKVWSNKNLDSKIGGAVLVDGFLYGSGDSANRAWQCVNWETGEIKYSTKEVGKGGIIYADGLMYWYSDRGELALVKATPDGFDVVSEIKVALGTAQHWAHPVLNDGRLFVRHGNTIIAYNVKG